MLGLRDSDDDDRHVVRAFLARRTLVSAHHHCYALIFLSLSFLSYYSLFLMPIDYYHFTSEKTLPAD